MRGQGAKFTRKMEEAVAAMLTQRNVEEAGPLGRRLDRHSHAMAEGAGVPEGLPGGPPGSVRQSIARLQQGTSAAATTLLKTMIDPNTPASVRVRAAEAIFNHAAKAIEIEDIEVRVSELERAAGPQDRRGGAT